MPFLLVTTALDVAVNLTPACFSRKECRNAALPQDMGAGIVPSKALRQTRTSPDCCRHWAPNPWRL